jgi:RiboL-PSP-HEPN
MAELTAIDRLYNEATSTIALLQRHSELSLEVSASDHFRKALLLAAASYFENRVSNAVLDFVRERANGSPLIENFVRNKAVARQYHSWFSWDANNANQFFGLFGADFKTSMGAKVKDAPQMQSSIRAFLELGNERNRLVHENYATFAMEKTLDEVYDLYQRSRAFVDGLPAAFKDCENNINPSAKTDHATKNGGEAGTGPAA